MARLVVALAVTLSFALAACGDNNAIDPCIANACALPAAPRCDGNTQIVTQPATCTSSGGAADCEYAETRTDCAASGMVCAAGGCHAPGDPCVGTTCATPPASTCDVNVLTSYDATGTCDGTSGTAECSYAKHTTDCATTSQICKNGACVDPATICAGVTCDQPPADTCTDNTQHHHPATGVCDGTSGTPVCTYPPTDVDCTATDDICSAGACVDPCATNPCTTPPADTCSDASTLAHHANPGTCTSPGGVVSCDYTPTPVDCTATDRACAAGACVDPCVGFTCTTPPPAACSASGVLTTFASTGTCTSPGGAPVCSYAPTTTDCAAIDKACDATVGACVDPCAVNPCTAPPGDTCSGNTLEQHPNPGTCTSPGGVVACDYTPTPVDCTVGGGSCSGNACINACTGFTCDPPPAATCTDDTLTTFAAGVCSATTGSPVCTYAPTDLDCRTLDEKCVGGACVDPCVGVTCDTPPPATCTGAGNNTARTFAASGTCSSPGGVVGCDYAPTDKDCTLTGQTCAAGACTGPVLFVRVQSPASITDVATTTYTVFGRIFVTGVTDKSGVDDADPNVKVEFGVGTGTDPTAYTYTAATPNAAYGPGSPAYEANNDEYQANLVVPAAPGTTQRYAFRLSNDAGTTWIYGDVGDAGSSDGFTAPGTLNIAAPYFSEYIEGTSNNKALEIYNPGSIAFPLAGCFIDVYVNGSATASSTPLTTTASIAAGDVFVLCHTSYALADSAECDQKSGNFQWNGDDAIALRCGVTPNQVVYDVLGQIGTDPGAEWGTGLTSTADNTLLRACTIFSGDRDGSNAFDPAIQWKGYATDSHFLGARNCPLP